MAVTVGNNALLSTPSAGGECVHTEGGGGALIEDSVKKQNKKNLLSASVFICLATTGALWGTVRPFDG